MVSHKEHLYVFGGDLVNTVEMYDPDVGHFVSINIVPSPISYTNAVVHEDNIIIVGHEMYVFDTNNNTFTVTPMSRRRTYSQSHLALVFL